MESQYLTETELDDRKEWDRAWAIQNYYCISNPLKADLDKDLLGSFGKVVSATISEDPIEFADQVYRRSEICPICGQVAVENERIGASLHPNFDNKIRISIGVWVHKECLKTCEIIKDLAPIPW